MKLLVKGNDNPRVVQVGRIRDARKWMRQYGQAGEVGEDPVQDLPEHSFAGPRVHVHRHCLPRVFRPVCLSVDYWLYGHHGSALSMLRRAKSRAPALAGTRFHRLGSIVGQARIGVSSGHRRQFARLGGRLLTYALVLDVHFTRNVLVPCITKPDGRRT